MNLWIRSQDKEKLICSNDISIAPITEYGKTIKGYKIVGFFDKNTEYEELGFYDSKERSLEVLDEIQELLGSVHIADLLKREGIIGANILYEMPRE